MEFIKESPPGNWSSWDTLMDAALDQARQAAQAEEIPVGAVLIDKEGLIIGQGYNQSISRHDPTAHAEILAIRQGCQNERNYRIPGSTLIVTLEPCIMCLGAIMHARISMVVFGAHDPKTGALGSRLLGNMLPWSNHAFQVVAGIRKQECSTLLTDFFRKRRQQHKSPTVAPSESPT
ncbi:tRNA adenosine(34) deaminase TadA [Desulfoplanes formicivorans]|nr:tRNA adenosine(34) deaminase TadA [Desulfoplanes formicivorans]